jgi:hypothetical protein
MYTEKLKESVRGIVGSFALKNAEITESNLELDLKFVVHSIFYFKNAITERRDLKEFFITGEKQDFVAFFHSGTTVGVVVDHTANILLLHLIVRNLLEAPQEIPTGIPSSLADVVPYLEKEREEILPNVPEYARQVLQYVDGKRTIRDIVADSDLPVEVVLDVIMAHRRSSVIHYKH